MLDVARDVPALIARLVDEVRHGNVVVILGPAVLLHTCMILILALLYTLSPLDVVPEAVFGVIGFVQ